VAAQRGHLGSVGSRRQRSATVGDGALGVINRAAPLTGGVWGAVRAPHGSASRSEAEP
jgi:hypothetical protein